MNHRPFVTAAIVVSPLGKRVRDFVEKHPDCTSGAVRAELGDTAATYVATMAVRGQLTRRRIGWQWHYSAPPRTPSKKCGTFFHGFRSRALVDCTLEAGHRGWHVHTREARSA